MSQVNKKHALADLDNLGSPPNADPTPSNVTPLVRDESLSKYEPKIEKPIHRLMCFRAAAGDSPLEISEAFNYSVVQVRNILKSENSRLIIAQIVQDTHQGDISDLLKGATVDAFTEITELMQGAKSEAVRMNCAKDILDRYRGKPVAAVPIDPNAGKPPKDANEEIAEIDKEIAKLHGAPSEDNA